MKQEQMRTRDCVHERSTTTKLVGVQDNKDLWLLYKQCWTWPSISLVVSAPGISVGPVHGDIFKNCIFSAISIDQAKSKEMKKTCLLNICQAF